MVALVLWASLPSGDPKVSALCSALSSLVGVPGTSFSASASLKVLPLCSFSPPLPIGSVYVGAGNEEFGLKPSVWCNPFKFLRLSQSPKAAYKRLCLLRPDLLVFLAPLGAASVLVCDCRDDTCSCHAGVLVLLVRQFSTQKVVEREMSQPEEIVCGECDPEEPDDELVVPPSEGAAQMGVNETLRGVAVPGSVGFPTMWEAMVDEVRSAPQRVFWEIFAGCAVLTSMFLEEGWCCGPPVDVSFDESFNLLNPAFVGVLLGLIFEGRVALLHVAPPCSSFSWAVNKFPSHAMRSASAPEGFWWLDGRRAEKVRLGNALALVSLRLCKAQEKVHGFWEWEQPKECLMFDLAEVSAFVWRLGVFLAEVYVCAFGAPWAKPTWVLANFAAIQELSRRCPSVPHEHIPLVGFAPCGRNWTAVAGPYWPAFARAWAQVWSPVLSECQVKDASHIAGLQCFDAESSLEVRLQKQGFVPSGRRSANVVAQRVAAGGQPARRAVPTLLPEGLGPDNHLHLALKLTHPFELPVCLPEHCMYACERRMELGKELDGVRTHSIALVEAMGKVCAPQNKVMLRYCHWLLKPVLDGKNVALMRELSWCVAFPDRAFLADYVLGMNTLFWADPAPRFVPRLVEPLYPKEGFWDNVDAHNVAMLARVKPSGDDALDAASWEKSSAEFEDGALRGPYFSLEEVQTKYGRVRLLPRFGIWEQHGGSEEPTVRNIDNGLVGEQNNFCGNLYTNRPADLDLYIGLMRHVLELAPDQALMGFTSDFKSAYRQCTANPDHALGWVLVIWSHEHQCQVFGVAGAQLFGCALAPTNFCRIPDFCAFVASRLFFLALIHCIDDVMTAEACDTIMLGYKVWRRFAAACGWNIPDSKSPPPEALFRVLGAMIDLRQTPLPPVIRLAEDRYEKLYRALTQVMESGSLASGLAGQLFGQLGFSCSQFFGRWGRAKLRPFSRRQHEPTRYALNDQLWSALRWWKCNLHLAPPRAVFSCRERRHVVVTYSDGEGADAGVGIAAWCEELLGPTPLAGFIEVPDEVRHLWSRQRESYGSGEWRDITEIEAIGPLLILHNWLWLVRDALWIHFIDNNGALGALVKGSASVHEQDLVIGETWARIAVLRVLVWFDRVDSASNPVDGLSRKDFSGVWNWREIYFPTSLVLQLRSVGMLGRS